jgi:hypothetical protein
MGGEKKEVNDRFEEVMDGQINESIQSAYHVVSICEYTV